MKPFSRDPCFKIVLFIELTLLFSFAASFSILKAIDLFGEKNVWSLGRETFPGSVHWKKNYRILKRILNAYPISQPPGKPDSTEIQKKKHLENLQAALNDTGGSTLTADFLKLQVAEHFLEEKKLAESEKLITSLENTAPFLEQKKAKLILVLMYARGSYTRFVDHFNNRPVSDPEINYMLIDSLIKSNQPDPGVERFKTLFRHTRISTVEKKLPPATVKFLLAKLDTDYWLEKWSLQARENDFTAFFREKNFVRSPELQALFYAEYHYARKRFSQARQHLSRIRSARLSSHKDKLLLKINLRENRVDDGEILNQLNTLQDSSPAYADLLFNTANILFTREKIDLAMKIYGQYLQLNLDRHQPEYWKALWITAWIKYRKNQKDQALVEFKRGEQSPILSYKIACRYWSSRLEKKNDLAMQEYPFTYYFARTELPVKPIHQSTLIGFTGLINQPSSPLFERITETLEFLLRRRLFRESQQFIKLAKSEENLPAADVNMLKIIESIIFLKEKKFYQAFVSFRNNFNCYQCIYLPLYLSQIYLPVHFEQLIKKHSRQNDIDPYLVMAVIREESFFKTDAVSRAKACGLMQMLYKTAREVAAKKDQSLKRNDLFVPDANIRLGIEYLKYLIDKYSGELHLALAAYNAGDFRVDRWIEQIGPVADDEFVELIPFSETRVYVKNIIRNHFFYRYYHHKESM